jgi:hypothetical protein
MIGLALRAGERKAREEAFSLSFVLFSLGWSRMNRSPFSPLVPGVRWLAGYGSAKVQRLITRISTNWIILGDILGLYTGRAYVDVKITEYTICSLAFYYYHRPISLRRMAAMPRSCTPSRQPYFQPLVVRRAKAPFHTNSAIYKPLSQWCEKTGA